MLTFSKEALRYGGRSCKRRKKRRIVLFVIRVICDYMFCNFHNHSSCESAGYLELKAQKRRLPEAESAGELVRAQAIWN